MATKKEINNAASSSDDWLKKKQKLHISMIQNSTKKLQKDILDSLNVLKMSPTGKLDGIKANLGALQKLQVKIEGLFYSDFNNHTRKIVRDFKTAQAQITADFKMIGEAAKFTNVDKTMMDVLRDGYYKDYLGISETAKQKVVQSMYDNVIAGGQFSDLESQIRQSILGSAAKGVVGASLAQYAKLYARDMIMNYHNEVNMKKAEDLGMDTFIYTGTIMGATRDFCRRRVGNPYTKKEINSWKYKWKGKSGPALTNRGGYNCRHHWQPVRKEWLDKDELSMLNKLAKLDKDGKPIKKKAKPVKPAKKTPVKRKPKPKPPEVIGKGTIPDPPTYESIQKSLVAFKKKPEYTKLKDKVKSTATKREAAILVQDAELKKITPQIKALEKEALTSDNPQKIYEKITKIKEPWYEAARKAGHLQFAEKDIERSLLKMEKNHVLQAVKPPAGGVIKFDGSTLSSRMKNKVTKNFQQTADLLHPDVIKNIPEQYVRYQSGIRAYYTKGMETSFAKRPGTLHLGSGSTATQTHEFGHAVEYSIKGLRKKARAFLKERAAGAPATPIYKGTKEMGWRDGFFNHYVGKHYDHGATEIVSMGLEQMGRSPLAFLKLDPGHFDFILKVMWGTL